MTRAALLKLARTKMGKPYVRVWLPTDPIPAHRVWTGHIIDFDRAQGIEVHGQSRREVERMLMGALWAMPRVKR